MSAAMRGSSRPRSVRRRSYLEVKTMSEDDLVREERAAREEYYREFEYDLAAIVRDLREQERVGGREVVSLPPRRPARTVRETIGHPASPGVAEESTSC